LSSFVSGKLGDSLDETCLEAPARVYI